MSGIGEEAEPRSSSGLATCPPSLRFLFLPSKKRGGVKGRGSGGGALVRASSSLPTPRSSREAHKLCSPLPKQVGAFPRVRYPVPIPVRCGRVGEDWTGELETRDIGSPAKMPPNLECPMYEPRFPEVDAAVMIQVKHIADMGAYVSLLEYNNVEGMILFSELSRRRIRSISSLIKVGRQEPAIVLRVDRDKGYIDLSKRRVSEEEARSCEDKYNKSKLVHSIMRHVAETLEIDLEPIYQRIGWPLYRKYGHAFEAFKLIVADPDAILDVLTYEEKETGPDGQEVTKVVPAVTPEIKETLVQNIRRRMTPQPLKIRADVEMKCFQFDGVLHIKQAMRKAEAAGNTNCPVKIKLVAPPLYVLTTQTLDKKEASNVSEDLRLRVTPSFPKYKDQGISVLTDAVKACTAEIEKHKGKLVVKEAPRAVSEREDKLLNAQLDTLVEQNAEVAGDDDSEDEEDTGMGDVDLTNSGVHAD
uniref:Eukaryotic translation initiation factor 2 subunit alpha n=1 Tax=Aegilops tauschii TaxID=37682 RepID=M8CIY9_AEGTA